ncbi:MAG: hypothetical protein K0U66_03600 [Gammaproteobacteria bacterium]|nr:hypothetical protein [Gammaproteobacteria bacterium]
MSTADKNEFGAPRIDRSCEMVRIPATPLVRMIRLSALAGTTVAILVALTVTVAAAKPRQSPMTANHASSANGVESEPGLVQENTTQPSRKRSCLPQDSDDGSERTASKEADTDEHKATAQPRPFDVNTSRTAPPNNTPTELSSTALSYTVGFQQIVFSWEASPGASHYRLEVSYKGDANFNPVQGANRLKSTTFSVRVRYWDISWGKTVYRLQTCHLASQDCSNHRTAVIRQEDAIRAVLRIRLNTDEHALLSGIGAEASLDNALPFIEAALARHGSKQAPETQVAPPHVPSDTQSIGIEIITAESVSADGNTLVLKWPTYRMPGLGRGSGFSGKSLAVYARQGGGWRKELSFQGGSLLLEEFGEEIDRGAPAYSADADLNADGSVLAVGYPLFPSALAVPVLSMYNKGNSEDGAVYIYFRDNDEWKRQAMLRAANADHADQFGIQVELSADGDRLAVSANGEDSSISNTDTRQKKNDNLGEVIDHNTDKKTNDNSVYNSGAIYIYNRNGSKWIESTKIKASHPQAYAGLGTTLALSADGRTLVAGTDYTHKAMTRDFVNLYLPEDKKFPHPYWVQRPVHVFALDNGQWSEQAVLWPPNECFPDFFGRSVSISDDGSVLAAGAFNRNYEATDGRLDNIWPPELHGAGAVHLYERHGNEWQRKALIQPPLPVKQGSFGSTVAVSADGSTLVVQAHLEHTDTDSVITDLVKPDKYQPNKFPSIKQAILYIY